MIPKKILVVEPDKDFRELLCGYLAMLGYAPIEAESGESALSRASALKPDLIVMEVRLPGKDGFQVIAELRRNGATCDIPVLAATAMARPEDQKKCHTNGFDAYLAKPFRIAELKEVLSSILAGDFTSNPP